MEETTRPQRVRIVLGDQPQAGRKQVVRAEFDQQTGVGEVLVRGLVRAQLGLAVRIAALVSLSLGSLPLLFALFPALGDVTVLGVRLPWLLLGVAAYPVFVVAGWIYTRGAERNERDFVELVERS
ncbi:cofactor assembly of complex C subunit B [Cryptosporangium sp. NPDC051539]|uniref:cofactor assembly of complex C subunit B n=1 Tax=Cryptosporangium sp. NPDC051539 TaxID=3363962 RepID=UPI0037B99EB3